MLKCSVIELNISKYKTFRESKTHEFCFAHFIYDRRGGLCLIDSKSLQFTEGDQFKVLVLNLNQGEEVVNTNDITGIHGVEEKYRTTF